MPDELTTTVPMPATGPVRSMSGGPLHLRVRHGMRQTDNWLQFVRFGAVGASGYIVNLVVFAVCVHALGIRALRIGAQIDLDSDLRPELLAFHEGPSRILISTANAKEVSAIAQRHGVEAPVVGATIEAGMEIRQRGNTLGSWDIAALRAAYEGALEAHVR